MWPGAVRPPPCTGLWGYGSPLSKGCGPLARCPHAEPSGPLCAPNRSPGPKPSRAWCWPSPRRHQPCDLPGGGRMASSYSRSRRWGWGSPSVRCHRGAQAQSWKPPSLPCSGHPRPKLSLLLGTKCWGCGYSVRRGVTSRSKGDVVRHPASRLSLLGTDVSRPGPVPRRLLWSGRLLRALPCSSVPVVEVAAGDSVSPDRTNH